MCFTEEEVYQLIFEITQNYQQSDNGNWKDFINTKIQDQDFCNKFLKEYNNPEFNDLLNIAFVLTPNAEEAMRAFVDIILAAKQKTDLNSNIKIELNSPILSEKNTESSEISILRSHLDFRTKYFGNNSNAYINFIDFFKNNFIDTLLFYTDDNITKFIASSNHLDFLIKFKQLGLISRLYTCDQLAFKSSKIISKLIKNKGNAMEKISFLEQNYPKIRAEIQSVFNTKFPENVLPSFLRNYTGRFDGDSNTQFYTSYVALMEFDELLSIVFQKAIGSNANNKWPKNKKYGFYNNANMQVTWMDESKDYDDTLEVPDIVKLLIERLSRTNENDVTITYNSFKLSKALFLHFLDKGIFRNIELQLLEPELSEEYPKLFTITENLFSLNENTDEFQKALKDSGIIIQMLYNHYGLEVLKEYYDKFFTPDTTVHEIMAMMYDNIFIFGPIFLIIVNSEKFNKIIKTSQELSEWSNKSRTLRILMDGLFDLNNEESYINIFLNSNIEADSLLNYFEYLCLNFISLDKLTFVQYFAKANSKKKGRRTLESKDNDYAAAEFARILNNYVGIDNSIFKNIQRSKVDANADGTPVAANDALEYELQNSEYKIKILLSNDTKQTQELKLFNKNDEEIKLDSDDFYRTLFTQFAPFLNTFFHVDFFSENLQIEHNGETISLLNNYRELLLNNLRSNQIFRKRFNVFLARVIYFNYINYYVYHDDDGKINTTKKDEENFKKKKDTILASFTPLFKAKADKALMLCVSKSHYQICGVLAKIQRIVDGNSGDGLVSDGSGNLINTTKYSLALNKLNYLRESTKTLKHHTVYDVMRWTEEYYDTVDPLHQNSEGLDKWLQVRFLQLSPHGHFTLHTISRGNETLRDFTDSNGKNEKLIQANAQEFFTSNIILDFFGNTPENNDGSLLALQEIGVPGPIVSDKPNVIRDMLSIVTEYNKNKDTIKLIILNNKVSEFLKQMDIDLGGYYVKQYRFVESEYNRFNLLFARQGTDIVKTVLSRFGINTDNIDSVDIPEVNMFNVWNNNASFNAWTCVSSNDTLSQLGQNTIKYTGKNSEIEKIRKIVKSKKFKLALIQECLTRNPLIRFKEDLLGKFDGDNFVTNHLLVEQLLKFARLVEDGQSVNDIAFLNRVIKLDNTDKYCIQKIPIENIKLSDSNLQIKNITRNSRIKISGVECIIDEQYFQKYWGASYYTIRDPYVRMKTAFINDFIRLNYSIDFSHSLIWHEGESPGIDTLHTMFNDEYKAQWFNGPKMIVAKITKTENNNTQNELDILSLNDFVYWDKYLQLQYIIRTLLNDNTNAKLKDAIKIKLFGPEIDFDLSEFLISLDYTKPEFNILNVLGMINSGGFNYVVKLLDAIKELKNDFYKKHDKYVRDGDTIHLKSHSELELDKNELNSEIEKLIENPKFEFSVSDKLFKLDVNPKIELYNLIANSYQQQDLLSTAGSHIGLPYKGKTIMEMEANAKGALTKRNSAYTATKHEYVLGSVSGIPSELNTCVIKDLSNPVYNFMADGLKLSEDGDESFEAEEQLSHDGAMFVSATMARFENNSLQGDRVGADKKQFAHIYNAECGQGSILKCAGFIISNARIRRSPKFARLNYLAYSIPWLENGEEFAGQNYIDFKHDFNGLELQYGILKGDKHYIYFDLPKFDPVLLKVLHNWKCIKSEDIKHVEGSRKWSYKIYDCNEKGEINEEIAPQPETKEINDSYTLWKEIFGGEYSASFDKGVLSCALDESSFDYLTKAQIYVGRKKCKGKVISGALVDLILKRKIVHYFPTEGTMKHGAENINTTDIYKDAHPHIMRIAPRDLGVLLNAEHHVEDTYIALMTLVINALGSRGYSAEDADDVYTCLGYIAKLGSKDIVKTLQSIRANNTGDKINYEKLLNIIYDIIYDVIIKQNNTDETSLLSAIKTKLSNIQPGEQTYEVIRKYLPIDDRQIFNLFVSKVSSTLSKESIRLRFQGNLCVLVPSDNFILLYNGRTLEEYGGVQNTKAFLAEKQKSNPVINYRNSNLLELGHYYLINGELLLIKNPSYLWKLQDKLENDHSLNCQEVFVFNDELLPNELGCQNVRFNSPLSIDNTTGETIANGYQLWNTYPVMLKWELERDRLRLKQYKEKAKKADDKLLEKLAESYSEQFNIPVSADDLINDIETQIERTENEISKCVLEIQNIFTTLGDKVDRKISIGKFVRDRKTRSLVKGFASDRVQSFEIDYYPSSVKIDTFLMIMPSSFREEFNLDNNDSVWTIKNDELYFFKQFFKENGLYDLSKINLDNHITLIGSQHTYNLTFTQPTNESEWSPSTDVIIKPDNKSNYWRILKGTNKRLYKVPVNENGEPKFTIYENSEGDELIYIHNNDAETAAHFVNNLHYSFCRINRDIDKIDDNLLKEIASKSRNRIFGNLAAKMVADKNYKLDDEIKKILQKIKDGLLNRDELKKNYDSYDENLKYLIDIAQRKRQSFLSSLQAIVSRTPAQCHQSFMAMDAVAFDHSGLNSIHVSRWQLWLLGSDYDIDKANVLTHLYKNGCFIDWSPLFNYDSDEAFLASLYLPFPTGKTINKVEANLSNNLDTYLESIKFFETKSVVLHIEDLCKVLRFCKRNNYNIAYSENGVNKALIEQINNHNLYFENDLSLDLESASENFISCRVYLISKNPKNWILGMSGVDEVTKLWKRLANESELAKESKYNNGDSIIGSFRALVLTLQGKQNVAIAASSLKVFEALSLYVYNVLRNGDQEEIRSLLYGLNPENDEFIHNLKIKGKEIRLLANAFIEKYSDKELKDRGWSETTIAIFKKAYGDVNNNVDACLQLSALLSLAADNAKDPTLSKINAGPNMIGLYASGIMMGIKTEDLIEIINSKTGKLIASKLEGNRFYNDFGYNKFDSVIDYVKFGPLSIYTGVPLDLFDFPNNVLGLLYKYIQQALGNFINKKNIKIGKKMLAAFAFILKLNKNTDDAYKEYGINTSEKEKEELLIRAFIKDKIIDIDDNQLVLRLANELLAIYEECKLKETLEGNEEQDAKQLNSNLDQSNFSPFSNLSERVAFWTNLRNLIIKEPGKPITEITETSFLDEDSYLYKYIKTFYDFIHKTVFDKDYKFSNSIQKFLRENLSKFYEYFRDVDDVLNDSYETTTNRYVIDLSTIGIEQPLSLTISDDNYKELSYENLKFYYYHEVDGVGKYILNLKKYFSALNISTKPYISEYEWLLLNDKDREKYRLEPAIIKGIYFLDLNLIIKFNNSTQSFRSLFASLNKGIKTSPAEHAQYINTFETSLYNAYKVLKKSEKERVKENKYYQILAEYNKNKNKSDTIESNLHLSLEDYISDIEINPAALFKPETELSKVPSLTYKELIKRLYDQIGFCINVFRAGSANAHYDSYLDVLGGCIIGLEKSSNTYYSFRRMCDKVFKKYKVFKKADREKFQKSVYLFIECKKNLKFFESLPIDDNSLSHIKITEDGKTTLINLHSEKDRLILKKFIEDKVIPEMKRLYPRNSFLQSLFSQGLADKITGGYIESFYSTINAIPKNNIEKAKVDQAVMDLSNLRLYSTPYFGDSMDCASLLFLYDIISTEGGATSRTSFQPFFAQLKAEKSLPIIKKYIDFEIDFTYNKDHLLLSDTEVIKDLEYDYSDDELFRFCAPVILFYELGSKRATVYPYAKIYDPSQYTTILLKKYEKEKKKSENEDDYSDDNDIYQNDDNAINDDTYSEVENEMADNAGVLDDDNSKKTNRKSIESKLKEIANENVQKRYYTLEEMGSKFISSGATRADLILKSGQRKTVDPITSIITYNDNEVEIDIIIDLKSYKQGKIKIETINNIDGIKELITNDKTMLDNLNKKINKKNERRKKNFMTIDDVMNLIVSECLHFKKEEVVFNSGEFNNILDLIKEGCFTL